jgi:PIN domain nuclease of toxin-antitoxin system
MIRGIADTHTVVWYTFADPRLSSVAKSFFDTTAAQQNQIGVSTITLAEIVYLIEKQRVPQNTLAGLLELLDRVPSVLTLVPFDRLIAEALPLVNRVKVPDFPDRLIAATATHLGVPLISRDAKIQVSGVPTIW